jgi:putative tryptophan/tyrosine transport system substrate-binding protein
VTGVSRRAVVGGAVGLAASATALAVFTGRCIMKAESRHPGIPRIGGLAPGPQWEWEPFRDGLRDAGWIEGRTISIEWRSAEGDFGRFPGLAAELVSVPVQLIATISSPATLAAKQATSTIPIVFCGNGDPVAAGLVQSLARPGGNLTGTTQLSTGLAGKRLSLLKELLPGLSRVAFIQSLDPASNGDLQAMEIQAAAVPLGITIKLLDVRVEADLEPAFAAASSWPADALQVGGAHHELDRQVIRLAGRERLPALYGRTSEVEAGGLLSYATQSGWTARRAASNHVDKILRGAKPAELPVEQPTAFDLAVNQSAAQALGLSIPPTFAAQVTEWVE